MVIFWKFFLLLIKITQFLWTSCFSKENFLNLPWITVFFVMAMCSYNRFFKYPPRNPMSLLCLLVLSYRFNTRCSRMIAFWSRKRELKYEHGATSSQSPLSRMTASEEILATVWFAVRVEHDGWNRVQLRDAWFGRWRTLNGCKVHVPYYCSTIGRASCCWFTCFPRAQFE